MRARDKRGASMVEFAIVVPLLMLLVFGIIEFSILLYDKAMLTNAAREGARAGIVYHPTTRLTSAEIAQVVRNYCQDHLVTFDATSVVNVSTEPTSPEAMVSGTQLTVTASYTYTFLVFPSLSNMFGATSFGNFLDLNARATMRAE